MPTTGSWNTRTASGADMFLDPDTFRTVVDSTPLVSIDLVVEISGGEILLGQRVNRPAEGMWFVPGGRIMKGESLDAAFRRIASEELGVDVERGEAGWLGIYEHFYDDSVFGDKPGTHYVVLAYHLELDIQIQELPRDQHSEYHAWRIEDARCAADVHPHTRVYADELVSRSNRKVS